MQSIHRTRPDDPLFLVLVAELNADLRSRYGDRQARFDPHNYLPPAARVVLMLDGDVPAGCGCYKEVEPDDRVEIKRMYVRPAWRRQGVAQQILAELERWASDEGFAVARLETADKQPESVALYQKVGYERVPNFEPYVAIPESICMEKQLADRRLTAP